MTKPTQDEFAFFAVILIAAAANDARDEVMYFKHYEDAFEAMQEEGSQYCAAILFGIDPEFPPGKGRAAMLASHGTFPDEWAALGYDASLVVSEIQASRLLGWPGRQNGGGTDKDS